MPGGVEPVERWHHDLHADDEAVGRGHLVAVGRPERLVVTTRAVILARDRPEVLAALDDVSRVGARVGGRVSRGSDRCGGRGRPGRGRRRRRRRERTGRDGRTRRGACAAGALAAVARAARPAFGSPAVAAAVAATARLPAAAAGVAFAPRGGSGSIPVPGGQAGSRGLPTPLTIAGFQIRGVSSTISSRLVDVWFF